MNYVALVSSLVQHGITGIGAISSVVLVIEYVQSRRMQASFSFPHTVRLRVNLRTYEKVIDRFVKYLDTSRRAFDIVIGIHYGGIGVASDLAAIHHRPFRLMETHFRTEKDAITCEKVIPHYRKSEVRGKKVLLVDNRIRSGRTLRMARDELLEAGAQSVHSVVLFRPKDAQANADYVIFQAGKWFRSRDFRK